MPLRGHRGWISACFFLFAATPGCWLPVLANILKERHWAHLVTIAYLIPPLSAVLSPLAIAARADQKVAAERLLFWCNLVGIPFLWLAFDELERGTNPGLFLFHFTVSSLLTAPIWPLFNSVALTSLRDREHRFGFYRVWATIGWIIAGWTISALGADTSPLAGKLSVGIRVVATAACLLLPHTPPGAQPAKNWPELLGLSSLTLLRQRDIAVFMLTTFLFSIPLAAYYMHSSLQLEALHYHHIAAGMTLGQISEVAAMLLLGFMLRRWRIKWLFLFAMACGLLRYLAYAFGASSHSFPWVLFGISFHGLCWTFFFEAGRLFLDRRVEPRLRSQAQALLSLISTGAGGVIGTLAVGWLHSSMVAPDPARWTAYWLILGLMCAACILLFALGYQGGRGSQSNVWRI